MIWRDERWRFETTLTPEECAARLRPAIDGYLMFFGGKSVIGHANTGGASLRKRIWYRNSFQTVLDARFRQEGTTTIVEGRTGMGILTRVFMLIWCGAVLLIGGGVTLSALSASEGGAGTIGAGLFPVGMVAFAVALVTFGRWLARDEAAFLLSFLRGRLDAVASIF